MTVYDPWKIVFIDDEEDIREVMTVTLEDAGYHVTTAENGTVGLKLCRQVTPQIVITDIRMPGMDGLQVLETVKKDHPDIEVIVATAFGEMELAIRALQLDASDFINKPINDEELQLALIRARDRYTSRKQLADYTALLEKENAETSQQLIKTFEFQKNLIESAMDGILACDMKGNIISFNKSMERISGYSRSTVIDKMSLVQLLSEKEEKHFREALRGDRYGGENRLTLYETTLLGNAQRQIPVQVSAARLMHGEREDGLICYFRDLREIRKLEREVADQARILHQDKMMSLGRLAASVVHEINNPLSGILNYLKLMMRIINRGGPLEEKYRDKFIRYLELVESETSRCSQIISSLLTFSRVSPPNFSPLRTDELLKRCIILSRHKLELSNIELTSSIQPEVPPVMGDFNQLQQCVINLIFNAIDAMPDGGAIEINGGLNANSQEVLITVKDSGHGISQADLPNVFEPFFTTKKEGFGVGLGLSTVYGIIERHKGTIDVSSREGEGSEFRIKLPVTEV